MASDQLQAIRIRLDDIDGNELALYSEALATNNMESAGSKVQIVRKDDDEEEPKEGEEQTPKVTQVNLNDANTAFSYALVGSEGLATGSTDLTAEIKDKQNFGDQSISAQSAMLSDLLEKNKVEMEKQRKEEVEKKKKAKLNQKKDLAKKKEEEKELEAEKNIDPELKLALKNDKFTEDMLSMLLKGEVDK